MPTLHLTPAEQKLFSALPANLQQGWTVVSEEIDAYEDAQVLQVRATISRLHKYPPIERMIEQLRAGAPIDPSLLDAVPEDVWPQFFFMIGATGIRAFMQVLLSRIADDDDVQSLAAMSEIRHDILVTNQSIQYV